MKACYDSYVNKEACSMGNAIDEEAGALTREKRIFAEYPVPKAVATMVVPTIISQIITVIYNLADTW